MTLLANFNLRVFQDSTDSPENLCVIIENKGYSPTVHSYRRMCTVAHRVLFQFSSKIRYILIRLQHFKEGMSFLFLWYFFWSVFCALESLIFILCYFNVLRNSHKDAIFVYFALPRFYSKLIEVFYWFIIHWKGLFYHTIFYYSWTIFLLFWILGICSNERTLPIPFIHLKVKNGPT